MMTRQRVAVRNTTKALKDHKAWQVGTKVGDYGGPIAMGQVILDSDEADAARQVASFEYDPRVVQIPRGKMEPPSCCSLAFGGLCEKDAATEHATHAVRNVFRLCQRKKIILPKVCPTSCPGATSPPVCVLLTRFTNRGSLGQALEIALSREGGREVVHFEG